MHPNGAGARRGSECLVMLRAANDRNQGAIVAKSRSELDTILDELAAELPMLLKDTEDQDDFWMAFTGLSAAIEDSAHPDDLDYVRQRINSMLNASGVIPPG
jgi:hypothetical protein